MARALFASRHRGVNLVPGSLARCIAGVSPGKCQLGWPNSLVQFEVAYALLTMSSLGFSSAS